ncbi:MAG: NADH-quinone oxidoreductase subunit C [Pseudomonadota bacterium]|nr:MAG: NADH-quinone oxidoreductase subunit C [Pseudomonadota bacterium]
MSEYYKQLALRIRERLGDKIDGCEVAVGELNVAVPKEKLIEVCTVLRDEADFAFEQLIDATGLDYSAYGEGEWLGPRYAVAYHLISVTHNHRVRVKAFVDGEPPIIDSVTGIWNCANWYEREAFDLFGIVFEGHPDLRRILSDYGFVGHPFRKDFPLTGNVEMRYDPEKQRVVYQPVSIDPRVNQPRIIRDDHRYAERLGEREKFDA